MKGEPAPRPIPGETSSSLTAPEQFQAELSRAVPASEFGEMHGREYLTVRRTFQLPDGTAFDVEGTQNPNTGTRTWLVDLDLQPKDQPPRPFQVNTAGEASRQDDEVVEQQFSLGSETVTVRGDHPRTLDEAFDSLSAGLGQAKVLGTLFKADAPNGTGNPRRRYEIGKYTAHSFGDMFRFRA